MVPGTRFGVAVIGCVIALRLGIGWHFYKEGIKKYRDSEFSAKYFLRQAKGPAAPLFHGLMSDPYGRLGLDEKLILENWNRFRDQVSQQLKFDEQQTQKAGAAREFRERQLRRYLADHGEEIREHFLEVERLEAARQDDSLRHVTFRQQWILGKQQELWNAPTVWLKGVASIGRSYQDDLLKLARADQSTASVARLIEPTRKTWVDQAVTFTVLGVGVLLLLGLFTRLAAVAGAGFLASVLATQPFWVYGADVSYAYYQFVELLALLLLAAIGAGRFGGLDYFTAYWWNERQASVQGNKRLIPAGGQEK